MAERDALQKRYAYSEMSNKVERADRRGRHRGEPTGEVESLRGRSGIGRMGDRVVASVDEEEKKQKKNKKLEKAASSSMKESNLQKRQKSSILSGGQTILDTNVTGYQPSTPQATAAYESLLTLIGSRQYLSNQDTQVLRDAAQMILEILKDQNLRDPERQAQIGGVLLYGKLNSKLSGEQYAKLVQLGKQMNDYDNQEEDTVKKDEEMDDNMGVAVVFDDSEEENESDNEGIVPVLADSSSEDDDDGEDRNGGEEEEEEDDEEDEEEGPKPMQEGDDEEHLVQGGEQRKRRKLNDRVLSVHEIDAHFLQRQVSRFIDEANQATEIAGQILEILGSTPDMRECENKLLVILGFEQFDTIKLFLKNRLKIWACIQMKRAQNDDEARNKVEEQLQSTEEGAAVLLEMTSSTKAQDWSRERMKGMTDSLKKTDGEDVTKALDKLGGIKRVEEDKDASMDSEEKPEAAVELDLEALAFRDGSHTMSNKTCQLPEKSWRAMKKGYEEVHVPPVRSIVPRGEKLIPIADLPRWTHAGFKNMDKLNRVQSKVADIALKTSENILLCAPTGAGKTNVAMLTMLNILGQHRRERKEDDDETPESELIDLSKFKIVYVAPMKALVQEVVKNFRKRLQDYGVTVNELSGDSSLTRQQIAETQLLVTTPEKWDIVTRQGEGRAYTQLVKLVIIDEIHLLHDERGPVLESIVSRVIRQVETTAEPIRLVGLSATLPNYADVGTFLRVKPDRGLFFFDHSYRPVPLQMQYIGITERNAFKRFMLQNEICYEKVMVHRRNVTQIIIFVHSRAETGKTAKALRDMAMERDELMAFVRDGSATQEILREESSAVKNGDLKDVISYGFGIHHAGMAREDRELVEDLFADRHLAVLVCTATLAWGVNLPAHAVIIKGTQIYNPEKGRWTELSPLDVLQMLGRSGRPQYDTNGEGIIVTQHSELQYYLSLTNLQLPVESQLIKSLPDHLNAEIVLGTVQTIEEAVDWISYTFLYVRMLQNPAFYGIHEPEKTLKDDPTLRRRRLDLAHTAASVLEKSLLIRYDRKSGSLQATPLGRVASRFYISHSSMAVYSRHLRPNMTDIEILRIFAMSGEFAHITVRENEKLELGKLAGKVPIPVKESPSEPSAKVNILLQAYISRLKLDGFALVADMAFIQQSAARIMRALFEISLKRNWSGLAKLTLAFSNMVAHRIWRSQTPLRQFRVPEALARKLERKSDIEWSRYADLSPSDLGELIGVPKSGRVLHKLVHQFPRLEVSAFIQPITRSMIRVELTLTPSFEFDVKVHDYSQLFHIFVEDVNGESLLHHEMFTLKSKEAEEEHALVLTVPILQPLPPAYFVRVIADRWLHSESVLPISFSKTILPSKFPPPTELLDLQPLPVTTLNEESFVKLFPFKEFNPIQTQTFHELYKMDGNVLVCAPSGSGKTALADFAILRMLVTDPGGKCVCVVPTDEIATPSFEDWKIRFGAILGANQIAKLTGDAPADLKLIGRSKIIVATVKQWDLLTRRWRQRKALHLISLVVFDELHFLSGEYGPTLEVIISRMRFFGSERDDKQMRMIGLSASLANAREVGEWMGVSQKRLFNFSPKVRPIPLEIYFQSFEQSNYASRLMAMGKPLYSSIVRHAIDKPVLVFVPSRKQAQLTAIDLLTYHESQRGSTFASDPNMLGKLEDACAEVLDGTLKQVLMAGIGFVYEGMSKSDRSKVSKLYKDGWIQIVVCPADQCWKIDLRSYLVVIMGTEFYDGHERRYVDYPVVNLLRMMGRATRQLVDQNGKCAIFCHAPKKEYVKKLLYDPLPIESHLDHYLHDHFNSEIVSKTIGSMQDAVDYLTWTFLYRRLGNNPNYYGLQGTSNLHLSEHMSEMVETVLGDLEESKCCQLGDDGDVSSLNLGMIAAYYYIQYTTIELVASSVTERTKIRGIMEILANAFEFSSVPIRFGEDKALKIEARTLPQKLPESMKFHEWSTKTLVLLQMHFSRRPLSAEMKFDQRSIVKQSITLIQAIVDVISSNGWLKPALAAMELSQMVVQGLWNKDHVLKQIPHFTDEIIRRCLAHKGDDPVEGVFDILNLDDDVRDGLLRLPDEKMADVAVFCNSYPNIEVSFDVQDPDDVTAGGHVRVVVTLEREIDEEEMEADELANLGVVSAPLFPGEKREGWWVVIGDTSSNSLLSLKRVNLQQKNRAAVDFLAPNEPGDHTLTLFCMSDSYMGCDQEYSIPLSVAPGDDDDDSDDGDDDSGSDDE